jgi:DNA-binding MarR family transcriptional regulator
MALKEAPLPDEDYAAIAAFRAGLRRFMRFSEEAAQEVGLTPQQHQLLLAIRGFPGPEAPTIGELAEALQIRHNSAVGLINRLEDGGYVRRRGSTVERRRVHVDLTDKGVSALRSLTAAHRREHRQLASLLHDLLDRVGDETDESLEAGASSR